jgi:RHS repeat-associated protein
MLSHTDANDQTTQYSYDAFGRLTTVINPNDSMALPTISYQYAINPMPPHSITSLARIVTGSTNTLMTTTFFDGVGRQRETATQSTGNNEIVSGLVDLDIRGQVINFYNPFTTTLGTIYVAPPAHQPFTNTAYDPLGRVSQVTHPDGTITTHAYVDWTETVTDANGHFHDYIKDAYGRIIQVNEHNLGQTYTTTYQYDGLNNLTQITNSLGQSTTMYYDTLNRKVGMNDPQMGNWQYQYDPNGNLILQTDANNQAIQMQYDALNRLQTKVYPDNTTLSYQYDTGNFANGRLSQVTDLSGSQAFTYDNLGRIAAKTRTINGLVYTTQMAYDDLGRETSVTYPNNNTVQNNYDGSFLKSVQDTQSGLVYALLTYDPIATGKLQSVVYGNQVTATYSYRPDNFYLTGLMATNSSAQLLQNFGYQYDRVGNILSITDPIGGMNQQFSYDDLDRLATAGGPYGNYTYAYDSLGNLNGNIPSNTDANGNVLADGAQTITYDFENRPVLISSGDGSTSSFLYDFEGNRVQKMVTLSGGNSQTSTYIGQIYEVTPSSTIEYITAGSLRVAMVDQAGNVTYFLPDHLGSTNVLADANQNVVRVNLYAPFGNVYGTGGSTDSDYKFTGQRLDNSTGIYYYGARYFEPIFGQFLTPDTIVQNPYDPQTLNRYAYCRNNPIRLVDPTGHGWLSKLGDIFGGVFTLGLYDIPAVHHFVNENKYYIAEAALIAATYGAATPAVAGAGTFTQAVAEGALAGEVVGGATNTGGDGEGMLLGSLEGGVQGAVDAGFMYGISAALPVSVNGSFSFGNAIGQIGLKGSVGGLMSLEQGGSFRSGFEYAAAFAAADAGYQAYVGYSATGAPGKELPEDANGGHTYVPNAKGQPPPYTDDFGYNSAAGYNDVPSNACVQGSLCGKVGNAIPGGNATAAFHDTWMNRVQMIDGSVGYWTNKLTMIPSALSAGAGLLGSDWAIVSQQFAGNRR